MVYFVLVKVEELIDSWILDFGCPFHVYSHVDWFATYHKATQMVSMGDNVVCEIVEIGRAKLQMHNELVRMLENVQHVPLMGQSLIFLGVLEAKGCMRGE